MLGRYRLLSVFMCVCLLVSCGKKKTAGVPIEWDKPIAINPAARTIQDVHQAQSQFLHRILTEAYLNNKTRDPQHEQAVLAMLAELEQLMLEKDGVMPMQSLRSKANVLISKQCRDPLVDFAYGYSFDGGEFSQATIHLKKAIEQLPKQGYSTYLAMRAVGLLELNHRKDVQWRKPLQLQGRQLFLDWLRDDVQSHDGDGVDHMMVTLRTYLDPLEDSVLSFEATDQFVAAIQDMKLPSWLKQYAVGRAAYDKAWSIRGDGFADTVRKDQWERMRVQLHIAGKALRQAHALSKDRHEPAVDMIGVCMLMDDPDFPMENPRYWFDHAIDRRFDAIDAYGGLALALLPRWSGLPQDRFMNFLGECVKTGRYDTRVPYSAVIWAKWIAEDPEMEGGYPQLAKLGGFDLINEVFQSYYKHETNHDKQVTYLSEWLFFCYLFDKPQTARQVYAILGDDAFDRRVLGKFRDFHSTDDVFTPEQINAFIARAGKDAASLEKAMACERDGQWDEAIQHYQRIKEQASDDPQLLKVATERYVLAQWHKQYNTGEWVSLDFNEQLNGWQTLRGDWQRIDDHTVQGVTDPTGLLLGLMFDPGSRFEMNMTIRFVKQVKPKFYNAGLMYINPLNEHLLMYGMLLIKDEGSLNTMQPNVPARVASIPIGDEIHMQVQIEDALVWVKCDGKQVYHGTWLKDDFDFIKQSHWYIGGSYMRFAGTTLQFADLKIRKMDH